MRAAAGRAHLTQPAISRNLKLLESDLGVALFKRVGRGLVLTAAGRALVPRARRLLQDADILHRDIARTAERQYHDLRLGSVDSVVTYLFPSAVAPLRDRFPTLRLKIETARTNIILDRLDGQLLDLAVVAYSGPPPRQRTRRVGHYDLQFHGRQDRFPELASVTSEEQLADFPIVEIEALSGQPTLIRPDAPSYGRANSLASVKALIMAGFGVGSLLGFMLTPAERAELVRARVPHDPDCGLFVVPAPHWVGEVEDAIAKLLADELTRALGEVAS